MSHASNTNSPLMYFLSFISPFNVMVEEGKDVRKVELVTELILEVHRHREGSRISYKNTY